MIERKRSFEILGLDWDEERLYVALVEQPGARADALAESSGVALAAAREALERLERGGFVERVVGSPARFAPIPPEVALDARLRERARDVDLAREAAMELTDRLRGVDPRSLEDVVEIHAGTGAAKERWLGVVGRARREILTMDRPPYLPAYGMPPSETEGAEGRILVDRSTLAIPGHVESFIARVHDDATSIRATDRLPVKMHVVDRREALVVQTEGDDAIAGVLIVHESDLLDALVALFETIWRASTPLLERGAVPSAGDGSQGPADRRILSLLRAGLTDAAIARALGVSASTVERRVRALMTALDATSRFQLGYRASAAGWLDDD